MLNSHPLYQEVLMLNRRQGGPDKQWRIGELKEQVRQLFASNVLCEEERDELSTLIMLQETTKTAEDARRAEVNGYIQIARLNDMPASLRDSFRESVRFKLPTMTLSERKILSGLLGNLLDHHPHESHPMAA